MEHYPFHIISVVQFNGCNYLFMNRVHLHEAIISFCVSHIYVLSLSQLYFQSLRIDNALI